MNGTFGKKTYSNDVIAIFIIGINHNASREGENLIHFEVGKNISTGNATSFTDTDYPLSGDSHSFRMNTEDDNTCGWVDSMLRLELGSDDPSPSLMSLSSILPDELVAVMKSAHKYSFATGSMFESDDYVSIFSEKEVLGSITSGPKTESFYQEQYEYYSSGNSSIHYTMDGEAARCWTRSVYGDNYKMFTFIDYGGQSNGHNATRSLAVSPIIFV